MSVYFSVANVLKIYSLLGSIRNRLLNTLASLACGRRVTVDWRDLKIIGPKGISIGKNFSAGRSLWIESVGGEGKIIIGDNVNLSDYVHIGCANSIEIKDGVLIGSNVLITDHSHGRIDQDGIHSLEIRPNLRSIHSKGATIIGRSVWIGDGVRVMAGVVIGDDSVVGANSVVVRDIPPATVWAGTPARQIWPKDMCDCIAD